MKNIRISAWLLNLAFLLIPFSGHSQVLYNIGITKDFGLKADRIILSDSNSIILPAVKTLFSFLMNAKQYKSSEVEVYRINDQYIQTFNNSLISTFRISDHYTSGYKGELIFENKGNDSISISNVVPFGEDSGSVYITGIGPSDLARACLFRPGFQPVRVILPDDAWEMGYSSFPVGKVCDVGEDIIHREIAIAFFNGYGTELNKFRPGGRDENYNNDLSYLARTTLILRQNNDAFLDNDWTPMIETTLDKVYVNRWAAGEKTIFTILNMRPAGVNGKLFEVDKTHGKHYVCLLYTSDAAD